MNLGKTTAVLLCIVFALCISPALEAADAGALPSRPSPVGRERLAGSAKMTVFGVEPVDVNPGKREVFRDLTKAAWKKPSESMSDEGWAALKEGGMLVWDLGQPQESHLFPGAFPERERKYTEVKVIAAPGEYEAGSLCIWPLADAQGAKVSIDDLKAGNGAKIPASAIDIRIVKWLYLPLEFRGETWAVDVLGKVDQFDRCLFQPALLVHDDTLIQPVHLGATKYTAGTNVLKHSAMDVEDADTIQPFDLKKEELKQIWLTVNIPENAPAGVYTSTIRIDADKETVTLPLTVQVLPFKLSEARWSCGMYYGAGYATVDDLKKRPEVMRKREPMLFQAYQAGRRKFVHSFVKTYDQMKQDVLDMKAHGITNVIWYCPPELAVRLMRETKFGGDGRYFTCYTMDKKNIAYLKSAGYEAYSMMQDEPTMAALPGVIEACRSMHKLGAKTWTAFGPKAMWKHLLNELDVPNRVKAFVTHEEIDAWHRAGKKVTVYGSPQPWLHCRPLGFRVSYGLDVWRFGFDGSMDFAYQWHGWNAWDLLDAGGTPSYKLGYTFPTLTKPVPTLMWESFREGNDDLRYLSTLLDKIEARRKSNANDPALKAAESFVESLKSSQQLIIPDTRDLTDIRLEMVKHVLALGE